MILAAASVAACAAWVAAGAVIRRNLRGLKLLRDESPPTPAAWPKVSVLVPACNEAAAIEAAVRSFLAQDYPSLEVVVVDDRSTDGTGAAVDRLAASDARVVPARVSELPPGWLGKVHALARARERAAGAWLLFTDADVVVAPGCLRRAVSFALAAGLDHLALIPEIPRGSFWRGVAIASFVPALFLKLNIARVGEPGSGRSMGVGAFNLVRAAALDATEGLAWLRMEVVDDFGLGLLLHRSGARGGVRGGMGDVSVEWYPSLRSYVRGLEKNAIAGLQFSYARAAAAVAFLVAAVAGLAAAPWSLPASWGGLAAAGTVTFHAWCLWRATSPLGAPWWIHVFAPPSLPTYVRHETPGSLVCRASIG